MNAIANRSASVAIHAIPPPEPHMPPGIAHAVASHLAPVVGRGQFGRDDPGHYVAPPAISEREWKAAQQIAAQFDAMLAPVTREVLAAWLMPVNAASRNPQSPQEFALRVAGGPKYSPFGRLAVHVIVPRLWRKEKLVPGPPKRFAQTVGLVFGLVATVLSVLGHGLAAEITIGLLVAAAFLEFAFGICLGCIVFGFLQRHGVIPETVCEACNNLNLDRGAATLDPARV